MNCEEFLNEFDQRLDARQPWQSDAALAAHVRTCGACQAHVTAWDAVATTLEGCPPSASEWSGEAKAERKRPTGHADRVLAELRSRVPLALPSEVGVRRSRLVWLAAAAAAVLVMFVGWRALNAERDSHMVQDGPTEGRLAADRETDVAENVRRPAAPEQPGVTELAREAGVSLRLAANETRLSVADVGRLFAGNGDAAAPNAVTAVTPQVVNDSPAGPEGDAVRQASPTAGAFDFLIYAIPMGG